VNKLHKSLLALPALLLAFGCISQPKIRPNYVGMGDLPLQDSKRPLDLPPYSDALELPSRVDGQSYRVGPLDELVVIVWGRDDLGSQVPIGQSGALRGSTVRADGAIVLPFLGPVAAAGKSVVQIRDDVQARYAKIIENPQVEVQLHGCASKSVEVGGEIERPGRFFLCDDVVTLGDVLSAAGGPTANTDLVRGVLTRDGHPFHLDYTSVRGESAAAEIVMQPGDHLFFPELDERVVYVFGEVGRQGIYPIPVQGMTLLGALARAKGIDQLSAKHQGIYLIRQQPKRGAVAYQLAMSQLLQGPEIALTNGDRLYVAMRPLERWDRWWRKALPFTTVRTNVEVVPE
jgi:polysaccharide export outer membrane protein